MSSSKKDQEKQKKRVKKNKIKLGKLEYLEKYVFAIRTIWCV